MTQCGRSGIVSGNRAGEGTSIGTNAASSGGAAGDVTDQNEGTSSIGRSDSARVSAAAEDTSQDNESQSSFSTSSGNGGRLERQKRGIAGSGSILSSRVGAQVGSFLSRPATVDAEYEFLAIYMELSERDRMAVGHDFEGMFKQCIFEGVDCLDERYILCIISLP